MELKKDDFLICRNSNRITMLNKRHAGAKLIIDDKSMFDKSDDELIKLFFCTNIRKP